MNTSRKMNAFLLSVLVFPLSAKFHFLPKIGGEMSILNITQNQDRFIPHQPLTGTQAYFKSTSIIDTENNTGKTTRLEANDIYFGPTPALLNQDNLDGIMQTQIIGGIEIRYYQNILSNVFNFYPVLNCYGTAENFNSRPHINAGFFDLTPKPSFGMDMGLGITRNGDRVTLGAGAKFYRGDVKTSKILGAIADIFTDPELTDLDLSTFQKEDETPYSAEIDWLLIPYGYLEVSTEIGDLLSVFVNIKYGLPTSPNYHNLDPNSPHFTDGHTLDWQLSTVSFGIQSRLDGLL